MSSLDLLRPLLPDACSTVRQCAVVAAARLGEHDEGVARQLLNSGMITITLENLNKYNVSYWDFLDVLFHLYDISR